MNQNEPTEAVSARLGGPQATDGESEGRGGERVADGREGLRGWTQLEARAFNAILPALRQAGEWLPLTARRAVAHAVLGELKRELDALAEYENTINWHTTCISCARVLDSCARETERAEKAETELARLREGEQPLGEDQHPATASPAQWLRLWNQATPEERLAKAALIINTSKEAADCFFENHRAKIAELELQLAALREVARGYCPECGRGDATPPVEAYEEQRARAQHAEAVLQEVLAVAEVIDANGIKWAADSIRRTVQQPPAPARTAGPTVAECAEADRAYWERKGAGEGQ